MEEAIVVSHCTSIRFKTKRYRCFLLSEVIESISTLPFLVDSWSDANLEHLILHDMSSRKSSTPSLFNTSWTSGESRGRSGSMAPLVLTSGAVKAIPLNFTQVQLKIASERVHRIECSPYIERWQQFVESWRRKLFSQVNSERTVFSLTPNAGWKPFPSR